MKHLTFLWRLAEGLFWALLLAVIGGFLVLNEEYLDAVDEWRA